MAGRVAGRRQRERADGEWRERWRALGPDGQERVEAALAHGAAVDSPQLARVAAEAAERRLAASRARRGWILAFPVAIMIALLDGDPVASAGTLLPIVVLALGGVAVWRHTAAEQRRLARAREANAPPARTDPGGSSASPA